MQPISSVRNQMLENLLPVRSVQNCYYNLQHEEFRRWAPELLKTHHKLIGDHGLETRFPASPPQLQLAAWKASRQSPFTHLDHASEVWDSKGTLAKRGVESSRGQALQGAVPRLRRRGSREQQLSIRLFIIPAFASKRKISRIMLFP